RRPPLNALILQPVMAQIGLMMALYVWLSLARLRAVGRGEVGYDAFVLGRDEPRAVARITRNLANQFELPVLMVGCVALLVALGEVGRFDVACAWLFVAGRLAHTAVQTLTDDVRLRGRVFGINLVGFLGLAGHLGLIALAAR
ncbi:MAPEG family protein, partial [Methylobacterium sp. WL12]